MKKRFFFRADGNSKIGLGHLYRCSAVAQMVNSEFLCLLVTKELSKSLWNVMVKYFGRIIIIDNNEDSWREVLTNEDIVILDGYQFNDNYQSKLKPLCNKLVCIDDVYNTHFYADIVINHAGGLNKSFYDLEPHTSLYLGPSYSIVRSVFWNKPSVNDRLHNHVFVCLGGADPNNELINILKEVIDNENRYIYHVVTGSAYRFENELTKIINKYDFIFHYKNLGELEIKQIMQKCAIAIVAPSTVSYEYLSIGGELYLYQIAENQYNIYNYLIEEGLALPFHAFKENDRNIIHTMLEKQNEVFDGKSYERIREVLING